MYAYIGRQAIYNSVYNIAGYELLYRRGGGGGAGQALDGDEMTRSVLSDAVNVFGIPHLTNGLPAYINFTRNLLMDDFAYLFSPKEIIVEVPGNIHVDDTLVNKLAALNSNGYRLSLNSYSDFNGRIRFNQILGMFDVIRLDIGKHSRLQVRDMVRKLRTSHAQLLAERVETESDFEVSQSMNFTLFQGYYFEKPSVLSKQIPLTATAYGNLLNELSQPNPSYDACCRLLQNNAVLSHMFLRKTLGVGYNRSDMAPAIRRGMATVGIEGLRHWVGLTLLKQTNITNSDELPRKAYLRGQFLEGLMERSDIQIEPGQGFILGILSLLDQVTGTQLPALLSDLNLDPMMKSALLGRGENVYTNFLSYVVIYETGNERLILPDIGLHMDGREISALYMKCITETDAAFFESDTNNANAGPYRGNVLRGNVLW